MDYTIVLIKDIVYGYEYEIIDNILFVNISKMCRDHHKDIEDWKKEHYGSLFLALETFVKHHKITQYKSLTYQEDLFVDPSIAFHLAYWINYNVGISYCSIILKMISLIRS